MEYQIELEGFEVTLFEEFVRNLFNNEISKNTPMHDVRARAGETGKRFGRVLAMYRHKGEVSSDALMMIRAYENEWKDRLLDTTERQLGPAGDIRAHWNSAE